MIVMQQQIGTGEKGTVNIGPAGIMPSLQHRPSEELVHGRETRPLVDHPATQLTAQRPHPLRFQVRQLSSSWEDLQIKHGDAITILWHQRRHSHTGERETRPQLEIVRCMGGTTASRAATRGRKACKSYSLLLTRIGVILELVDESGQSCVSQQLPNSGLGRVRDMYNAVCAVERLDHPVEERRLARGSRTSRPCHRAPRQSATDKAGAPITEHQSWIGFGAPPIPTFEYVQHLHAGSVRTTSSVLFCRTRPRDVALVEIAVDQA